MASTKSTAIGIKTPPSLVRVISHRFSTARTADRILVLAPGPDGGGQVAEIGTHDELLALGGTYADLFRLQAAGYQ